MMVNEYLVHCASYWGRIVSADIESLYRIALAVRVMRHECGVEAAQWYTSRRESFIDAVLASYTGTAPLHGDTTHEGLENVLAALAYGDYYPTLLETDQHVARDIAIDICRDSLTQSLKLG